MIIPHATYRIQLHAGFTLAQLEQIVDYLHDLGISTIYASPVTEAVKGSMHGYDVTDPTVINAEIGTDENWERLAEKLRSYGISWLQDIVPNHMAFDSDNPWIFDVLERGVSSEFHDFFDIDWDHPDPILRRRLMAPFLGDDLSACIRKGEIRLDHSEKGFLIRYYDIHYPVAPSSWSWLGEASGEYPPAWQALTEQLEDALTSPLDYWQRLKKGLLQRAGADPDMAHFIAALITRFNEDPYLMQELLARQHYALTHFKEADEKINYRRFFTVNSLICLRMEDERVFTRYHRRLHEWYKKGLIQGLRIDHIDGLADPAGYIRRLKKLFGGDCYMIAEKILQANEHLPGNWGLEGMTGYEFLFPVNQLMTDREGDRLLLEFYKQLVPGIPRYREEQFANKYDYLKSYMCGELDNLLRLLLAALPATAQAPGLREALAVLMACFPVYRVYPGLPGLSDEARRMLEDAFQRAAKRKPDLAGELSILRNLFDPARVRVEGDPVLAFRQRLMQFTGPLAAKGIEDTTFYTYDPMISHNEVGDTPGVMGIDADEFHRRMIERQATLPLSLNATSTHDTKRGEDARIRLNMLSAMPEEWITAVNQWRSLNRTLVRENGDRRAPTLNDEYFIYQSLIGGVPQDLVITDTFRDRFKKYLVKALREAKTETSWAAPDETYENDCLVFSDALLGKNSPFRDRFTSFAAKIVQQAAVYSLSQLLIKLTAPGIPDIYQGAELWDISFVDPDNRRPVNYDRRNYLLKKITEEEKKGVPALFDFLVANRLTGVEKLFVIKKTLAYRKEHPLLFTRGEYIPLPTDPNMVAYLRCYERDWLLVIVPVIRMEWEKVRSIGILHLDLPTDAPLDWKNEFTGQVFHGGRMPVSTGVFAGFPVTLLSGRNG